MIKPDGENLIIIIGAMKSGTTSLFKHLSQLPEVISTQKTETHFFSTKFDKGLNFYQSFWEPNSFDKTNLYLEASPTYFKCHLHKDVPKNIFNSYPKAKLICILRHPIDRLETNYRQYINDTGNKEGINTNLPEDLVLSSMYYHQIKEYLKYFGKNQIKIVKTKDLKTNPEKVLDDVCTFLNTKKINFKNLSVKYGDRRVTNTGLYQNLRKFRLLKAIVKHIPQKYKYILIRSLTKDKDKIDSQLWKLNSENREKLLLQFTDDNNKMINEFNIDVLD
ncbi:sulfotransferase [Ichthyenterobacterium sp. W332]|uniref:Sulfotransferase n=1 Tax=Microcosmobacter mediterraneus TaxID=3075607 RepID=A0ABU2YMI8_9FLAO|nr:sulfotransferase domain-containing protein [Ichthyenterobacterium sp. W332]MDT0559383.1 sulfotransferase [Ichthyenterobacterium sp. W332]